MNRLTLSGRNLIAGITTALVILSGWPASVTVSETKAAQSLHSAAWGLSVESTGFVIESVGGDSVSCRDATPEETRHFDERDRDLSLLPIGDFTIQADAGLQITLRGTAQLDTFPEAKAAFERAAAIWQTLIRSNITIIVDVDFGPMRFGVAYPQGVIGATATQNLFNSIGYISLRNRLIDAATDPLKIDLYSALPNPVVVTDIGNTTGVVAPSAALRMIGEISPVANPQTEPGFGNPPAIGFNSAFNFDFDPSNGIDSDKIDFESVAVHEIGHALGFTSQVGARELVPATPVALSIWDLFRFRPGISFLGFTAAQRVQLSGGDQVFFAGASTPALSTGKPDGTGGDGRQASHWKDDALSGQYLGVMDPTLGLGFRGGISANDLAALDAIGYRIGTANPPPPPPGGNNKPAITSIAGTLGGDTLALQVNASDVDGDLVRAELTLLDGSNNAVSQTQSATLMVDPSPTRMLNFALNGMGQFPTALKVRVDLVDSQSNRSGASTFDFSVADSGGPDLRNVNFVGEGPMIVKGGPFTGALQLEINGVLVAPPLKIKVKGEGAKLKIPGTFSELKLRNGPNRIRLFSNGLRSKIFILSL
jgi:hypothetical protein